MEHGLRLPEMADLHGIANMEVYLICHVLFHHEFGDIWYRMVARSHTYSCSLQSCINNTDYVTHGVALTSGPVGDTSLLLD